MLGPDEPRYAAIGRGMARTGDWIAPVLWGRPWFEKPPLLYWMTGAATRIGLGPDLAPRLPNTLLGWGFLVFLWLFLRREFGDEAALISAAILGTSAGWVAYSYVAVTDIPLSAMFCAAMLIALYRRGIAWSIAAGALLGLAVLAKGLVPLALFAPLVWPLRSRIRDLALIGGACVAVALPWYALMTARFGAAFLVDFIWKHHFERFATDALAHVRPWWFYIPALLGALVPWTPLLALVRRDARVSFLLVWLGYALVFFSAARNKLPGYILPLLPVIAVVIGVCARQVRYGRAMLAACGLLLALLPVGAAMAPDALAHGLSKASLQSAPWMLPALCVGLAIICAAVPARRASAALAVGAVAIVLGCKVMALPAIDQRASARRVYDASRPECLAPNLDRNSVYQMDYYAGRDLPECAK